MNSLTGLSRNHNAPITYVLKSRIELRRSEIQKIKGYTSLSEQYLKNALEVVNIGLSKNPVNNILNEI